MQPRLRSRTFRRMRKRTPGGREVIHYIKRKPKQAHCSSCGGKLHGIPRLFPKQASSLRISSKRPERPYGGTLCSKCTRVIFAEKARVF